MWGWFAEKKASNEQDAKATTDTHDVDADFEPARNMTCTDLVQLAATTPWEEWATFILMTRNHNIDYMTNEDVILLFEQYKQCRAKDVAAEPCSPRQLAEFIYLLPPPRWLLFQQFAATVNINSMSFTNLIVAFLMFENMHTTKLV